MMTLAGGMSSLVVVGISFTIKLMYICNCDKLVINCIHLILSSNAKLELLSNWSVFVTFW